MSSTIQVGKRIFTTDAICEQLTNSDLLPQLLREMIIDEILADEAIESDHKIPYGQAEFREGCDRLGKLAGYQGLNQLQLYKIVDRHLRLQQFKHARWNSRVYSYYLKRKDSLDRLEFSLIGVKDRGLAEELFFRVQRGEQSFAELAFKYSEDDSAKDGGKISSGDINLTHPELASQLFNLRTGEISSIISLSNLHIFVRFERFILADLDDNLNRVLIDELFETWVQQRISERLGLFELRNVTNSPVVSSEAQLEIDESESLESTNQMDEQGEQIKLIEPSCSLFFPKIVSKSNYDFEDTSDPVICSSLFFPKNTPTEIIRNIDNPDKEQKFRSFLCLFFVFLGLEIMAVNIFNRLVVPKPSVDTSQIS
jgi:PPIC-type PPIASE domain